MSKANRDGLATCFALWSGFDDKLTALVSIEALRYLPIPPAQKHLILANQLFKGDDSKALSSLLPRNLFGSVSAYGETGADLTDYDSLRQFLPNLCGIDSLMPELGVISGLHHALLEGSHYRTLVCLRAGSMISDELMTFLAGNSGEWALAFAGKSLSATGHDNSLQDFPDVCVFNLEKWSSASIGNALSRFVQESSDRQEARVNALWRALDLQCRGEGNRVLCAEGQHWSHNIATFAAEAALLRLPPSVNSLTGREVDRDGSSAVNSAELYKKNLLLTFRERELKARVKRRDSLLFGAQKRLEKLESTLERLREERVESGETLELAKSDLRYHERRADYYEQLAQSQTEQVKQLEKDVRRLERNKLALNQQLSDLRQLIAGVEKSVGFRLGRMAVAIPRRLRQLKKRSGDSGRSRVDTLPADSGVGIREVDSKPTTGAKETLKVKKLEEKVKKLEERRARLREDFLRSGAYESLEQLRDKHKGQRCFILGNGPSLKELDLSLLKGDVTFVSNWFVNGFVGAQGSLFEPTYYCICSHEMFGGWANPVPRFNEEARRLLNKHLSKTHKFFSFRFKDYVESEDVFPKQKIDYLLFDRPKYGIDERGEMNLDLSRPMDDGYTVIITFCLPLAAWMGFSEVYLIGCDCDYGIQKADDPKQYFYDTALHKTATSKFESLQRIWSNQGPVFQCYSLAEQALAGKGVKLLNATKGGKLDVLPRVDFTSLFQEDSRGSEKDLRRVNG